MNGGGIIDGSLVRFKNTDRVENETVVAVTIEGCSTIKRFINMECGYS